jgi:hypothetical protein
MILTSFLRIIKNNDCIIQIERIIQNEKTISARYFNWDILYGSIRVR